MSGGGGIVDKARSVAARVGMGENEASRSLPIRHEPQDIRALWDMPDMRAAIFEGIPVKAATLTVGEPDRDWGRTVTLHLELTEALPDMATQALAGKVLRRLKALCETGEIPTTDRNPSAREDAGEPA